MPICVWELLFLRENAGKAGMAGERRRSSSGGLGEAAAEQLFPFFLFSRRTGQYAMF